MIIYQVLGVNLDTLMSVETIKTEDDLETITAVESITGSNNLGSGEYGGFFVASNSQNDLTLLDIFLDVFIDFY